MTAAGLLFTVSLAGLAFLLLGFQLLVNAVRFLLWMISTKAGWIFAGILVLVALYLRYR
ncbi:hypothetical protein [Kocuria coralli]|uniref:hypothetical protein n=1 Tax=Kocuria coralli TaxID=1461025 RepID=UPI0015F2DD0A|nr:hypothetical protein [Kocuria coralli]